VSPQLSRRLAAAFAVGLPTAEERERVIAAAEPARVRTVDDLPDEVQRLVRRLES
jgi:hypothetical protein